MGMVSQKEAIRLAGKLKQPPGWQRPSWKRAVKVVKALCRHLPHPYPGIRLLAYETKIPTRSVAHLLAHLTADGVIARVARGQGYAYRLLFLDAETVPTTVPTLEKVGTEEDLRSSERTTSSHKPSGLSSDGAAAKSPQRKRNRYPGECCVCGFQVRAREGLLHGFLPVHGFCDTGITDRDKLREYVMDKNWQREQAQAWAGTPAFGEDPEAPLPVHASRPSDPAAKLVYQFQEMWHDVLRRAPELKQHRCVNMGAAIGYIRTQFLAQEYSPEHVVRYFEEYFDTLVEPSEGLNLKEGQTAWQLFCGWWGTTSVPDPKIERERAEALERLRERARELQAAKVAAEREAWIRIEAAQERGEEPADEDLIIAIGFAPQKRRSPLTA